jgi:hypothetical protein
VSDPLHRDAPAQSAEHPAPGGDRSGGRFARFWTAERGWQLLEIGLIFAFIFAIAGTPPPDVNESHYLAKAKHYWNPAWCRGDFFLESADAHLVFYWTVGWLTRFLSLDAVAWVGRVLTWLLLAWSWQRLSSALLRGRLYSVLTAGLFVTLLDRAQMAGEWVVGGVEAKGFAYVLVLVALRALALGQWNRVWLLLGAASAFHVLVGGWSVLAALFAWLVCSDRKLTLRFCACLAAGFVLALPGLLPSATLTWGTEGEVAHQAARIYVFQRLGHHLVFHRLLHHLVLRSLCLAVVWLVLSAWQFRDLRCRRLSGFIAAAVLIALIGIMIDVALPHQPTLAASLLRFYWFRLVDVALPLGVSLLSVIACVRIGAWRMIPGRLSLAAIAVLVVIHTIDVVRRHQADPRPGAVAQLAPYSYISPERRLSRLELWKDACRWIRENTPEGSVFLTPRYQQTFKWYASRAETVNYKDVPQDAKGLVEWWHRMEELHPRTSEGNIISLASLDLRALAEKYHFQYVLVDRNRTLRRLPFPKVFPPDTPAVSLYEVYKITPQPSGP